MTIIRYLTDEDEIVKLFPIAIAGAVEAGKDLSRFNPDKLWKTFRMCLDTAIIIAEKNEEIIGFISLYETPCYYADEPDNIICHMFQVAKKHRGKVGTKLLTEAKSLAIRQGQDLYFHDEAIPLGTFFERNNFFKFSTIYKLKV